MNWVVASMFMFLSSVAMYLFIRKSNLLKTPLHLNILITFIVPLILYLLMANHNVITFKLNLLEFMLIVIQGVIFGYLGWILSLKGVEYAKNPGYSLIIQKSYVVLTAIISVYLFNDSLTYKSVIAIICIILFSGLIVMGNDQSKSKSNKLWIPYTIGAFFCWMLLALSSKYMLNLGIPVLTRLIYYMAVGTIVGLIQIYKNKINIFNISINQWIVLLFIGIFTAGQNYFMQTAFNLSPNVGYVNAVNAASISVLTVMSAIIFKDELSIKKMIGVVGVTVGLLVLFL